MAISYLDHKIIDSSYVLYQKEKDGIPVDLNGGITVSQDSLPGKIKVEFHVRIGDEASVFCLEVKTLTSFVYDKYEDSNEDRVKKECIPVSLEKTKADVMALLKDHGITKLVLPDFDE